MYHIFFIHSSVDGHLCCFHVLAIVNSTAGLEWFCSLRASFLSWDQRAAWEYVALFQVFACIPSINTLLVKADHMTEAKAKGRENTPCPIEAKASHIGKLNIPGAESLHFPGKWGAGSEHFWKII